MDALQLYYEILGVPEDIEQSALRRAYFKALKAHPVDKSPDRHQAIRKAYDVLGDPQKRREYDLSRENAGELGELLSKAQEYFEQDNFAAALMTAKKAVVLSPTLAAEKLLVQCYLKQNQTSSAIKIINTLVKQYPEDLELHTGLAFSLLVSLIRATDNEPEKMTLEHKKTLVKIKELFDGCIEINPEAREGYMGHARIEYYLERYQKSEQWCQRAIDCDDAHDFDDFDSFMLKLEVLIFQKKTNVLEREARYLLTLVPSEEGYKDYAHGRLIDLASRFFKQQAFKAVANLMKVVNEEKQDPELTDFIKEVNSLEKSKAELDKLLDNDDMYNEFKKLGLWSLWSYLGDDFEEDRSKYFSEAIDGLSNAESSGLSSHIVQSIYTYRNLYPNLYKLQDEFWGKLLKNLNGSTSTPNHHPPRHVSTNTDISTNDGCGCLVFLVAFPLIYLLTQSLNVLLS